MALVREHRGALAESMDEVLKPIGPDWIAPSLLCEDILFGLCQAKDGTRYLCKLKDETEGWKPFKVANEVEIKAFEINAEQRREIMKHESNSYSR